MNNQMLSWDLTFLALPPTELSMADPFMPVYGQGTLLQAIEYFASGLHRAAVFNKITSLLTNIITQSGT